MPANLADTEANAQFHMLEQLADFDDELMEQLLSDVVPAATRCSPIWSRR